MDYLIPSFLALLAPFQHLFRQEAFFTFQHLVVDDTLCHKRGAKVAFGGIFLDPVLSSRRHKVFRYGLNWVTLGLVVQLPFRPGRPFCVNLLWRLAAKKGNKTSKEHRTKPQL